MEKKSKILFIFLIILTVVSIYLAYSRSFITKDFIVIPVESENSTGEESI